jgi:hypothetical protein
MAETPLLVVETLHVNDDANAAAEVDALDPRIVFRRLRMR